MDQRIERVIALMNDDLRRGFRLSKMAQSVNLSPTRLSYLFKSETGTPPARYLRTLRMNDAAMLLASTFLTVKEIKVRVGFSDESHFVRYFKRTYGMTPTEYRRLNLVAGEARATHRNTRKRTTNKQ
jgi:transcriptional regulator GlxA family with amidase domain